MVKKMGATTMYNAKISYPVNNTDVYPDDNLLAHYTILTNTTRCMAAKGASRDDICAYIGMATRDKCKHIVSVSEQYIH